MSIFKFNGAAYELQNLTLLPGKVAFAVHENRGLFDLCVCDADKGLSGTMIGGIDQFPYAELRMLFITDGKYVIEKIQEILSEQQRRK